MHHERLATMAKDLASGRFGPQGPTAVTASFCVRGDEAFFRDNIRVRAHLDALGCVGDLGWYCVRLGLFCFGWSLPHSVSATCNVRNDEGVPLDLNATLLWKPDRAAPRDIAGLPLVKTLTMSCSFLRAAQQWCVVTGPDAVMVLEDFVVPKSTKHAFWTDTASQEVNMWLKFSDCVLATQGGAAIAFWPALSLATQLVTDALMQSASCGGQETRVDAAGVMQRFSQLTS
jgi:hypothetical protein